jgi:hypothetical protein
MKKGLENDGRGQSDGFCNEGTGDYFNTLFR